MKYIKKLTLILLSVILVFGVSLFLSESNKELSLAPRISAAEIIKSGSCGPNVTYTLDSDGTLTISGNGAVGDNYYSVASVPWYSFRSDVKNIIISEGITSLGAFNIYFCNKVYGISVDEKNEYYSNDEYGALFNKSKTRLIRYPAENYASCYIIPDTVTDIDAYAFSCCRLQNIIVPESVEKIGYRAFEYCYDLQSITIPDSVGIIQECTFLYCRSLESVTISDSVTRIGRSAFENCSKLQSVYIEDLTKWFSIDFANPSSNPLCNAADLYVNGNTVTNYTFPDESTNIGSQLSGCTSLINVTIPDSVTRIGTSAFENCSNLQSITIPDSVTDIGDYAFSKCSSLQQISIPDSVTNIGNGAFGNCRKLQKITIPKDVKIISGQMFANCSNLQIIYVPDGVTSIGEEAFLGCSNLQVIIYPDSITKFGKNMYSNCHKLKCIIYKGTIEQWNNISTDTPKYCLGDGYVDNGQSILNQNKTLLLYNYLPSKIYTLPAGIKSVEQKAFYDNEILSAVILPEGLKNIGAYAFKGGNLRNIYLPSSVSTIDNYAFNSCSSLSDVYFGGTEEQFKSISIGDYNTYLKNATIHYNTKLIEADGAIYTEDIGTLVAVSNQKKGAFIVPSSVTKINSYAFSDCGNITEISIPESVTVIGNNAFRNCDGISEITLPAGITKLENYVFYDCDKLQSITIPEKITSIGEYLFYGCEKLKTITFNSGLLSVGNYAFYGCNELEKLSLPKALTTIGNYAFSSCTKLSEIYFPSSLTTIGSFAFSKNSSLTYVSLPDSVNSLGIYAFNKCTNLEKICLPEGTLASIPANAFNGCSKLISIFIPENITSFGDSAFLGCNNLSDIYYGDTEAEWDKISIVSSNSVIWAANIHFEHTHTNNDWQVIIEPGSDSIWLKASICDVCGYEKREELDSKHTGYAVDPVSPTCLSVGYTAGVYCTECEEYISGHEEIEALGHDEATHNAQTPTCTEIGWDAYVTCSRCDYTTYIEKAIDSSAHKWDGGVITTFATCKINGVRTYTCEYNSEHTYTENLGLNVNNHINTRIVSAVEPTCSAVGYTAGIYCDDCLQYVSGHREIAKDTSAHKWDDGAITAPATCKTDGVKTYTCQHNSAHTYTEKTGLNGANHVNTMSAAAIEATCSEIGYTSGVYCNDCQKYVSGHEEIGINADNHKWNGGVISTFATCKINGVRTYTCEHNPEHTYTENLGLNVNNHINTRIVSAVEPTCSAVGYTAGVYCNDCLQYVAGHREITMDSSAHKWDNGVITTPATCKAGGVKTYTCQHNSQHTYNEKTAVNASNHINTVNVMSEEATCSEIGYTAGIYCNDCQKYISGHEEIKINAENHKWDGGEITSFATCKVNGVKTYTCENNSEHAYTENLGLNVNNHVNTKNVAEVSATCSTVGYTAGVYCNDCQKYISGHQEIAINTSVHKWDAGKITTTATCKLNGVKTYTCLNNSAHTRTETLGLNVNNHINIKNVSEVEATCSTVGYTVGVYCNDCRKYVSGHEEIKINAEKHKWDGGEITTFATCKVNGVKTYTCEHNSEHTRTENLGLNKNNHVNTKNVSEVSATCSTVGYTAGVFCNDCQKYISGHKEIATDSSAHKWDAGKVTSTATCKVNEVKTYTCLNNSAHTRTETRGFNENNHVNTKNVAEVNATCSTVGYTVGVYCNDCRNYVSGHEEIKINAENHKWDGGEITTFATCKVNGVKTYICEHNSEHTRTETHGLNANNHVDIKNVEAKAPTCSSVGYTAGIYCNDCQKYISGHQGIATDASAHKWDAGKITTTATCKLNGVKTYTCLNNSAHTRTEHLGLNENNHVNTKNVAEVEATCFTVGYTAGVYCNDCQKYISGHQEIAINTSAHKWDTGKVTATATCKVKGIKTYTCQNNSNHTYTETLGLNASNHVNTKNVAEVEATCSTVGYTAGIYCNDCQMHISGHNEVEKNPSAHVNTKNVAEVPATTEKVGYTAGVYCNDCQKYISGHTEIPKLEVTFTDSENAKEAGEYILVNSGFAAEELLAQAGKGALITDSKGNVLSSDKYPGTGMTLTLSSGKKYTVIVLGDVDCDGTVSAADARLALRASVGLEQYEENSYQYIAANVESNDKLFASDARLILRAAVGLEKLYVLKKD